MSRVNLGNKKRVAVINVFDIKGFKKRKGKTPKVQPDKLVKARKNTGKQGRKSNSKAPPHKSVGVKLLENGRDMASQILESAKLMGLVLQEDKQQAYEKILYSSQNYQCFFNESHLNY